jgi:hypothetical protein
LHSRASPIRPALAQYSQAAYSAWRFFMSSNSSTMRSRYQALAVCRSSRPGDHGHQVQPDQPVGQHDRTGGLDGVGHVGHLGLPELLGDLDLVALGPDVLAEDRLGGPVAVEAGLGNSSGLTTMKTSDSASGTSEYQPIQSRLQIEAAISGRTANRVQTLSGLAWRSQLSPGARTAWRSWSLR